MKDMLVDAALRRAITTLRDGAPPRLYEAIAYAVFPGGARIRPRLCIEVAKACAGEARDVSYAAATAVELLHCASLAHDDLPCFDDADTRRGLPSVHRKYDEATAVLVGDGLIVHAFETLARALAADGAAPCGASMLVLLTAAGSRTGLVAGQAWELEPAAPLAAYHRAKTGSLFEAAASLGALSVGEGPAPFAALGRAFGAAYQIADDVADRLGDAATLGKPVGRDLELGRPTAATGSEDAAIERLEHAAALAVDAVPTCPGEAELRRFVEGVFGALVARVHRTPAKLACSAPKARKSRVCA